MKIYRKNDNEHTKGKKKVKASPICEINLDLRKISNIRKIETGLAYELWEFENCSKIELNYFAFDYDTKDIKELPESITISCGAYCVGEFEDECGIEQPKIKILTEDFENGLKIVFTPKERELIGNYQRKHLNGEDNNE